MTLLEIRIKHEDKEQIIILDQMTEKTISQFERELKNKRIAKVVIDCIDGGYLIIDKRNIAYHEVYNI